jgi:two-component system, LytTR family, sensor kinase
MKQLRFPVFATHVSGWLLFQGLPLAFLMRQWDSNNLLTLLTSFVYWQFFFYYVVIYYLHSYLLFPRLYVKGKRLAYLAAMLLVVSSVFLLKPFEQLINLNRDKGPMEARMHLPPKENPNMPPSMPPKEMHIRGGGRKPGIDIISTVLLIMTLALSVAIDLTRRWRETERRASLAETEKANAELLFLKAQINPHFLFNTLNNIYSMAVTKNENTAGTIMKLSNIMRYVTDDVNEDYVSLQSEVDCITDYIDLQKLRLGKKVALDFTVTGHLEDKKIAPLILMTFIENLFKYGTSNHENSILTIRISATEQGIDFFSQNRLFATDRKIERTGIGISNTKLRLEHLYAGKHRLDITRENGMFTVTLSLYE